MVSSSRSNKETTNRYSTDNRQFYLEGIDGPALMSEGDIALEYTDHGTVAGAFNVADDSLAFGADALDFGGDALATGERALEGAAYLQRDALDYADRGAERSHALAGDSLDFAYASQREAGQTARNAMANMGTLATSAFGAITGTSSEAMQTVDASARDPDARTTETLIKYGAGAAAATVLAYALVRTMRG